MGFSYQTTYQTTVPYQVLQYAGIFTVSLCSIMPEILKSIRESLTVHKITSQHEVQLAGHFNICSQVVLWDFRTHKLLNIVQLY